MKYIYKHTLPTCMTMLIVLCSTSIFAQRQGAGVPHTLRFAVESRDWIKNGPDGTPGSYLSYIFKSKMITPDVYDNGAVMVYVLGETVQGWYLLPHSYYTSGIEQTTNFNCQNGQIELRMYDASFRLGIPGNTLHYKLVVIPGESDDK